MKIFQQEISESHRNVVKGQHVRGLLCEHKWFVLGENGVDEILTFWEDGFLTISNKGKKRKGTWRYNSYNQSVHLVKSDFICDLRLFFWNRVVLVLQLREDNGYLFLINAAYKDRFDCMVLEDFNAYASQWEHEQAAKGQKMEALKNLKIGQKMILEELETMRTSGDLSGKLVTRLAELWAKNEQRLEEEVTRKQKRLREKQKSEVSHLLAEQKEMTKKYSGQVVELKEQLELQKHEAHEEVSQLRNKLIKELDQNIALIGERRNLWEQKIDAQRKMNELKRQLDSREQPEQPKQPEAPKQPEPSDRLEQLILTIKQDIFGLMKMKVKDYIRFRSLDIGIEMDIALDKDKKYKKMFMTKIIVITSLAVLVLFLLPYLWNIIYYDNLGDYLEILLYTSFLFIGGAFTILAYYFFNLSEDSYKVKLKGKIEEEHNNDFMDSLMP